MMSLEEIRVLREKMQTQTDNPLENSDYILIQVGMAECGIARGAQAIWDMLKATVQQQGMEQVKVVQNGCTGLCEYEPKVTVCCPGADKVIYVKMNPKKALEVLQKHVLEGTIVKEYTLGVNFGRFTD